MIMKQSAIILVVFLFNKCWGEDVRVELDKGSLIGQDMQDRHGDTFYSFQSIPFAKPPINELRFKEPEEAEPWDEDRLATEDLPICTQYYYDGSTYGTEDCLYLNVYTKQLQTDENDVSLPVMVWIYGGGFYENAGRRDLFSPEFLLTEDIVLVTVNYRVGIFGSFHLSDASLEYPGNLGLKDQSFALKWVQENIAKFGGNPDSVTIFGESAGGASVHFHVLSPLSTGRFHKAIIQSGTAIGPWINGVPNNGISIAEFMEIPTDNPEEMIQRLLALDAFEIYSAAEAIQKESTTKWASIYAPIIEENVDGLNNFITEEPLTLIENGNYNHVPLIVGYNDKEGISFHSGFDSVASLIPGDLGVAVDSDRETELITELRDFYFGGVETAENTDATIQMFTDVYFSYPAYRLAQEHRKTATEPIYFYRFSADTKLNVYKLRNDNLTDFIGATHCDELGYLFLTDYHTDIVGEIFEDTVEDRGINRIVTLWTNFAKYDNPTPDDDSTDFTWLPVTDDAFNYVDFETEETVPDVNPDPENMQFWSEVYEKYSSDDGAGQENNVNVTIGQGVLNGQEMEDFQGGTFYSFQSIPYAKPPIGDLRFKEPEEAEAFDDRDATVDLPFCYQQNANGETIGQEDCLYLNVYTKNLQTEENDVLLDVMVWIHGGGFVENSGRQDLYSPEYLLTRDIVLVTINYRLGIFGSFHLENTTLGYPGNLGLKDQSLALRWVQSNIANFGGNPDSVTIFGESAGGASVHYHVLSPLSAGTFHKAIIQSGTAISPWAVGVENNGILLADALEVETDDNDEMIAALLDLDADVIFTASVELMESYSGVWASIEAPIVEEEVEGFNSFITEEPLTIIQSGTYNDVPIMVGYTDAEGISFFQTAYTSLASFIPSDLVVEDTDTEAQLIEELQNYYFSETGETTELIQLYTDCWFSYPAVRLAKEHAETANSSIYFYRFSADTQLNVYKLIEAATAGFSGAGHQDELGYLFRTQYHDEYVPILTEDTPEYTALENLVTLWVNFAMYGNPTPEDFLDFTWLPVTTDAFNYIDFGTDDTELGVDPDAENIEFWSDVYEKYSSGVSFRVQPLVIMFSFVIAYLRY